MCHGRLLTWLARDHNNGCTSELTADIRRLSALGSTTQAWKVYTVIENSIPVSKRERESMGHIILCSVFLSAYTCPHICRCHSRFTRPINILKLHTLQTYTQLLNGYAHVYLLCNRVRCATFANTALHSALCSVFQRYACLLLCFSLMLYAELYGCAFSLDTLNYIHTRKTQHTLARFRINPVFSGVGIAKPLRIRVRANARVTWKNNPCCSCAFAFSLPRSRIHVTKSVMRVVCSGDCTTFEWIMQKNRCFLPLVCTA